MGRESQLVVRRALVGALASLLLLTACGGGGGGGSGSVTLQWFMWTGSPQEVTAWKHLASMVTQAHSNIHIEFMTSSFTDYWTKLPTLSASGTLPCLLSLQSLRTAGYADNFMPLDSYISKDKFDKGAFDSSIVQGLSYKNHQLALPYDFGPLVVFYNQDEFQKAGLSDPSNNWTFSEFMADAKKLTQGSQYGFGASPSPDTWFPFALSDGASYLDGSGKLDLTNPGLGRAFQTAVVDMARGQHVSPQWPSAADPQYAQEQWMAGTTAMHVNGPWQIINFKSQAKFKFGIAPIPRGSQGSTTLSAGSGFGISKTCKNPDQAWQAIQVLTGPDAEKYLASNGRAFAARTSDQQYWYSTAGQEFKPPLQAALTNARPYRTTPNWNQVSNLMLRYGVAAMNGQMSATEALSQAQSQSQ